ncbi:hypothetical protein CDAR_28431 [Caerostris darwini]|uniref:Uncharacterized protein n=1 Tax=Caerostris darwini TaxID=1538125 RepID=A0AAV4Q5N5_9ARAC|nr:hypothetical protein CDAR_28431 [Caerostris darwini]
MRRLYSPDSHGIKYLGNGGIQYLQKLKRGRHRIKIYCGRNTWNSAIRGRGIFAQAKVPLAYLRMQAERNRKKVPVESGAVRDIGYRKICVCNGIPI